VTGSGTIRPALMLWVDLLVDGAAPGVLADIWIHLGIERARNWAGSMSGSPSSAPAGSAITGWVLIRCLIHDSHSDCSPTTAAVPMQKATNALRSRPWVTRL